MHSNQMSRCKKVEYQALVRFLSMETAYLLQRYHFAQLKLCFSWPWL